MEQRKTKTGYDLLRSLDGDGWAEIAQANQLLAGLQKVDSFVDTEAEAIHMTAQALDTDRHEGEQVRLIGYSRTENGDFSLGAVEGEFDMISLLEVDEPEKLPFIPYTDKMVTLCVTSLGKNQSERRYFPLHPEALLSAEVLPSETNEPKYLRKLRRQVNLIEQLVEEEEISDGQTKQDLLDGLNITFDTYVESSLLRVDCTAYSRFVGARSCGVFVDARGQIVTGQLPSFVWQGNRPVLEMFDDEQEDVRFQIDIDDIQAILPLPEDDEPAGRDLLNNYFGEEFQQTAWWLAKDLSCTSPKDYAQTRADYLQILTDLLPGDSLLELVSVAGFAWSNSGKQGVLKREFIDTNNAYVDGLDFIKTKNDIRVVLKLTTLDQPSTDSQTVYIEPSADSLLRFETLYEPEYLFEQVKEMLHQAADHAQQIAANPEFYNMKWSEQRELLQQCGDEARESLRLGGELSDMHGSCEVRAYRCLPSDLINVVDWNDADLQEALQDGPAAMINFSKIAL